MELDWYQKMIAAAQQRQGPQPQTRQQAIDAAKAAAKSTQTFAMPALADPNWKPKTTADVLGADYVPPEGGPSIDQLNASPVWQSVLSTLAGAPSTIPNSKDMPLLLQNLLSGVQSLDPGYYGPRDAQAQAWADMNVPLPGQAGWVNPTWAPGARPGGVMPPAPSTNDLGHYFPDASGSTWEPFQFGQASDPNSWLGGAQQSFQQGPPSTPVVNQWGYQQQIQPQQPAPMKQGREGYWQNHSTDGDYSTPRPGIGPWGKAWYA